MQTRDEIGVLHNCREFSQPLDCLHLAMQTYTENVRLYCLISVVRSRVEGSSQNPGFVRNTVQNSGQRIRPLPGKRDSSKS